ncbi:hypothetical protein B0T16DRAFT_171063 [Cercophora newfieldiana]|uniref:Uncharacterized protein n=1 Tax=Cercophora newfieldiana TaxID=92897 RepID=A0AA39Y6G5_9PEZI|nr:hypothetical protein B0T16DRAFT_171063 [Cercophora newfieldiana]
MTTRNLNSTWRDTVFNQYEADHAADVPFPIRYLIFAPEWKKDIFIEAPNKIDPPVFRRAVLDFVFEKRSAEDPVYESDHIKVRARVSPFKNKDTAPPAQDDAPTQDGADRREPGAAGYSG